MAVSLCRRCLRNSFLGQVEHVYPKHKVSMYKSLEEGALRILLSNFFFFWEFYMFPILHSLFVTMLFLLRKQINTELKEQLNNRFGGCERLRTGSHAVPACTQTTAPCPRLETTISAATLGYRVTEANRGQPALPPLWRYQQTPLPPQGWVKRMSGEQYFSIRGKHPAIVMLKGCLCYPFLVSCPLLALCTYRGWRFPDTGIN